MAIWRAQVEWDSVTNLPADKIVNTFHFEGSASATDLANIDDMLTDFYNETYLGGRLAANFSGTIITGDMTVKIFCLDDPMPRLPRGEFFHDITVGSAQGLPAEVALCMSYEAAPISGGNQARRRGRVYLGPWTVSTCVNGRPIQGLLDQVSASASELLAAANASTTWQWVVYSRENAAGVNVDQGWVDNAWDTQRRRGVGRTVRQVWE